MKTRIYSIIFQVIAGAVIVVALLWQQLRKLYRPLVVVAVVGLTSCAEYPIAIAVQGEHGTYSYSAKRGIELTIDATK